MKENWKFESLYPRKEHNIIVCANFDIDKKKEIFNFPFNTDSYIKSEVDIGVWKIKAKNNC